MEFRKMVTTLLRAGSKGDIDVKNRLLDSVGEGEGRMIWEQHWNMYITICETDDQYKF